MSFLSNDAKQCYNFNNIIKLLEPRKFILNKGCARIAFVCLYINVYWYASTGSLFSLSSVPFDLRDDQ